MLSPCRCLLNRQKSSSCQINNLLKPISNGKTVRQYSQATPVTANKVSKEIQIPVPWGHISGKWWGRTDVQPVLLLHGWQDNAGTFDTLAPLLTNESLLALDMVGHGHSSHYPLGQSYIYIDAIVNLRRVVTKYGWDKISIIGHSMGSLLGFGYASLFREGVEKFVSLDGIHGAVIASKGNISQELRRGVDSNINYEKKLSQPNSTPKYPYSEIADLYWKGNNKSSTREMVDVILKRGLVKSPDGEWYSFSRDARVKIFTWGNLTEKYIYAMAERVTCEVLHVRSKDSFTSLAKPLEIYENSLKVMEKNAKKVEYHQVDGTHHVHLNNPERVAPIINKFFESNTNTTLIY